MLERGSIKTFAILCPPHLCEQWQKELADKEQEIKDLNKVSKVKQLDKLVNELQVILFNIELLINNVLIVILLHK